MKNPTPFQTFILTILALIAFAANSVFCRLAMGQNQIDAASFTSIRLLSGALTMLVIFKILNIKLPAKNYYLLSPPSAWLAPAMLTGYAWCFSFAYIQLNTATGALILFATVQLAMLSYNLVKGNRPNVVSWLGISMAIAGFVYLMLPSATQPDLVGFLWMLVAGLCWAVYTIAGKGKSDAIAATGDNFYRSVPLTVLAVIVSLLLSAIDSINITIEGTLLAMLSGCFASACGYTLWYLALKNLTITQAAVSQLSVPVIAALGGIIWLAEPLTPAFILSAGLILMGIMLTYVKIKVKGKG